MKLEFLDIFSTNTQISDGMKMLPVRAELFHADGRTDITKLIVALRNYANESKNHIFRLGPYWMIILCNQCVRFPERPKLTEVNILHTEIRFLRRGLPVNGIIYVKFHEVRKQILWHCGISLPVFTMWRVGSGHLTESSPMNSKSPPPICYLKM
jgi:hypothetical protein